MTVSATSQSSLFAATLADTAANTPPPRLHNACGLLQVRAYGQFAQPSPRAERQFDEALRAIGNTTTGAALLRAIDACGVPAHMRPVCIFYERDPLDGDDPEFEEVRSEDVPTINFNVLPPGVETDEEKHAYRLMTLFIELITVYAANIGQPCADPTAGFRSFRMAAFREEIGHPAPQWLADLDDYVLEGANHGEDRRAIKDIVADWVDAGNPADDLDLSYQSLASGNFPPLRAVPGLTRLNVAGNRITRFPPIDRLPPTLRDISLAGNPVETGADAYGENLRLVVLSLPDAGIEYFRTLLPPEVRIYQANPGLIELFRDIEGLRRGVVSNSVLTAAGYSNERTAQVLPKEALVTAVRPWLAPHPVIRHAWLSAHEGRANQVLGMISMLDRLTQMPAAQDTAFRARFADLLDRMQQPGHEGFFDVCLEIAGAGAESCDDRILETLNELFIAWQGVDGDTGTWVPGMELMQQARQAFALAAAKQFIGRLMPELQARFQQEQWRKLGRQGDDPGAEVQADPPGEALDELQQLLMLRTRIAKLDAGLLPPMQFDMQFPGLSILNDHDIGRALAHIHKAQEADWVAFLAEWKPLKIAIRRTAPSLIEREDRLRKHINMDRGWLFKVFGRLLEEPGTPLFPVKYRAFWTRYERQVDRKLAEFGAGRDDEKIVEQAAAETRKDIELLLRGHTLRQFLLRTRQPVDPGTRFPEPPKWFRKLLRQVPERRAADSPAGDGDPQRLKRGVRP